MNLDDLSDAELTDLHHAIERDGSMTEKSMLRATLQERFRASLRLSNAESQLLRMAIQHGVRKD